VQLLVLKQTCSPPHSADLSFFRPDPVGDVGRTQYVAMVNNAFRVYNKETGAPETAVLAIGTVWQNLAVCAQSDG
jgi:hypothetical protein